MSLDRWTTLQLFEFVERNHGNAADLEYALAELRKRKAVDAKRVARTAEAYLRELKKDRKRPDSAAQLSAASPRSKTEIGTAPMTQKPSTTTLEERRWTDEAVASLRKKLIDLSKKNPLINFRHSTRGA